MKWEAILARFGFTSARVESPQTLAAANRRQRASIDEARAVLEEAARLEAALPASPDLAGLRRTRVALEAASERLRMRVEFFRTDRLSIGGGDFVNAASTSRTGDSLGGLTAATAQLVRDAEALRAGLRALAG